MNQTKAMFGHYFVTFFSNKKSNTKHSDPTIQFTRRDIYFSRFSKEQNRSIRNGALLGLVLTVMVLVLAQSILPNLFNPNKPQKAYAEIESERKPNLKVYQRPDGKKEYHVYSGDVNYLDADGKYKEINTKILNLDGQNFLVNQAPYEFSFQKDPSAPMIFTPQKSSKGKRDYSIKVSIDDRLNQASPEVRGNVVTYKNILNNTDLIRVSESGGIKQSYIFQAPGHPYTIKETLETKLKLQTDQKGNIVIFDGNTSIAEMPQPFIIDKNGKTEQLNYVLINSGKNKYSLSITVPDLSGFTYPVTLDPTIYNIQPNNYRLTTNNTTSNQLIKSVRLATGSVTAAACTKFNIATKGTSPAVNIQFATTTDSTCASGFGAWSATQSVTADGSTWSATVGTSNLQLVLYPYANIAASDQGTVSSVAETATKQDTYISSATPTTNYGTNTWLTLSSTAYPLLYFDLSSAISVGQGITTAYLNLYQTSTSAVATNVYPLTTSGWTEAGASWTYRTGTQYWASGTGSGFYTGDYSTAYSSSLTTSASAGWQQFNISTIAQAWTGGGNVTATPSLANNGLVLTTASGTSTFNSADYATDPNLRPYISFVVGVTGNQPGDNLSVTDGSYTITGDHQGVNAYQSISVSNGSTLNIQSNDTTDGAVIDVNAAGGTGLVYVTGNSSIIPKGYYTGTQRSATNGKGVTLNATNVTVDTGSKIDASRQGYLGGTSPTGYGDGPGGGTSISVNGSGGGGYGGVGGAGGGPAAGGPSYGSNTIPIDLGSGGGDWNSASYPGASGGGAIKINATGTLTLNGTGAILANGGGGGTNQSGGSGGSIFLNIGTLTGAGSITATGGNATSTAGSGAGGRVAIYYTTKSGWTGTTLAAANVVAGGSSGQNAGGVGSLYLQVATTSVSTFGNQVKLTGGTILGTGATTSYTDGVNLGFWIQSNPSDGPQTFTPQVEIEPISTAFNCTGTSPCAIDNSTTFKASGSPITTSDTLYLATVNIPAGKLSNGTSYHWQASFLNANGQQGNWSSYGGNSDSIPADADFIGGVAVSNTTTFPDSTISMAANLTNTQSSLNQSLNSLTLSGAYTLTLGNTDTFNITNALTLSNSNTNLILGTSSTLSAGSVGLTNGNTNAINIGSGTLNVTNPLTLNANNSITFGATPATLNDSSITLAAAGANLTFPSFASLTNPIPNTTTLTMSGGTFNSGTYTNFTDPTTFNSGTITLGANSAFTNTPIGSSFFLGPNRTISMGNGYSFTPAPVTLQGGSLTLGDNTNSAGISINLDNFRLQSGSLSFGSNVTFSDSSDYTVGSIGTATLTFGGNSTINMANNSLTVGGGVSGNTSSIIPKGYYTGIGTGRSATNGKGLTVNALNVNVTQYSKIDASSQGYLSTTAQSGYSDGPGGGGNTPSNGSAGAGYGGAGGIGRGSSGNGGTYGSATAPIDLGSAGGDWYGALGGAGGGAIKINTTGTLTNNGSILANGQAGLPQGSFYTAGGSGGSIWLNTNTLTGSGVITAKGGTGSSGDSGGGGGGRVAIYYNSKTWTGTTLAAANVAAGSTGSYANGANGTLTLQNDNVAGFAGQTTTTGTGLKTGANTAENSIKLGFWYQSTSSGANVNGMIAQVEVKPTTSAFDGTTNLTTGTAVPTTDTIYLATLTAAGLVNGTDYHWQARWKNAGGDWGPWSSYGANSDGNPPGTPAAIDFSCNNGSSTGSSYPDFSYTLIQNLASAQTSQNIYQNSFSFTGSYSLTFGNSTTLNIASLTLASGQTLALGTNSNLAGLSSYTLSSGTLSLGIGSTYIPVTIAGGTLSLGDNTNATGTTLSIDNITFNSGILNLPSNASITRTSDFTVGATGTGTMNIGGNTTLNMASNTLNVGTGVSGNNSIIVPQGFYYISSSTSVGTGYLEDTTKNFASTFVGTRLYDTNKNYYTVTSITNGAGTNSRLNVSGGNPAAGTYWISGGLTINALNVNVKTYAKIDASAQGYAATAGPGGCPGAGYASSAGYGSAGSFTSSGGAAGVAYGSATAPIGLGSGGGNSSTGGGAGGTGGGAIKINSTNGTLTINGSILANGGTPGYIGGGGSGGSIFLNAGVMTGSGTISAAGGGPGAGNYGTGGAGGRVAIYYGSKTWSGTSLTNASVASGGLGGYANGTAGTLNLQNISVAGFAGQTKLDGTTGLMTGAESNETGIKLNFWYLADTGGSVNGMTPQIEYKPVASAFDGTTNLVTGGAIAVSDSLYLATVTINTGTLGPGDYHWRARFKDSQGDWGPWSAYGNNPSGDGSTDGATANTDFGINNGSSTGTSYPNFAYTLTQNTVSSVTASAIYQNSFSFTGAYSLTFGSSTKLNVNSFTNLVSGQTLAFGANSSFASGPTISLPAGTAITMGNGSTYSPTTTISGGTLTLGDNTSGSLNTLNINNITLNSGNLNLPSTAMINRTTDFTVGSSATATLTIGGNSTLNMSSNSLTIGTGVSGNTSSIIPQGYGVSPNGKGLTINALNISVTAYAKINANGQGYAGGGSASANGSRASGLGPGGTVGAAGMYGAGGAGYGNTGGQGANSGTAGGSLYGTSSNPIDLGSGGGSGYSINVFGGNGGGAVSLSATGTLTINGAVTANGTNGANDGGSGGSGGGSGGSILLNVGTFTGNGTLTANAGNGGNGYSGGGGGGGAGGRVAVYYVTKTWTGTTLNNSTVTNFGTGGTSNGYGTGASGNAGTLYMPPAKPASVWDGTVVGSENGYTASNISANWSAVTDWGGSSSSKYQFAITRTSDGYYWVNGSTWQSGANYIDITSYAGGNALATSMTVTGITLVDGTTYKIGIRAVNTSVDLGGVTTSSGAMADLSAPSQPGTPISTVSPTNNNKPTVNWTAATDTASGVKNYTLYWDTTLGGTTNSVTITNNTYTFGTSLADGTWYVKVLATDNVNNQSVVSNNGSFVVDTQAPSAPTGATIVAGSGWNTKYIASANQYGVVVSGNKTSDTVQVKIELSDNDSFANDGVLLHTVSNTLSSLDSGTSYIDPIGIDASSLTDGPIAYRITAYDAANNTSTQTVITTDSGHFNKDVVLPTVSNIVIASGTGWNQNFVTPANLTAAKLSGNKSNDDINIQIDLADNDSFTGARSNYFTVSQGTNFADATGLDLTSLSDGKISYRITSTDTAGNINTQTVLANSSSFVKDTQLPNNVTNLKGYQDLTSYLAGNNQLTNGNWYPYTTPTFGWDANSESDLGGYKYCLTNSASCVPTNDLGNTIDYPSNLVANDIYYFRVIAYDAAGNSSTIPTSFTYKFDNSVPGAVTGLTASTDDNTKVSLTWNTFSAPANAAPLDNYVLERVKYSEYVKYGWSLSNDSNWSSGDGYALFTLNSVGFTDDSANPIQGQVAIQTSVKYIYKIKVKDVSNSQYSDYQANEVYGMTNDGQAPSTVTNVNATACDGSVYDPVTNPTGNCMSSANRGFEIRISWNQTTDTGTGVAKYNIYRATTLEGTFTKVGEVAAPGLVFFDNSTTDPNNPINDSTSYYYRLTASDGAGNESSILPASDPTINLDSATTPDVTAPTTPTNVTASPMSLDGSDPDVNTVVTNGSGTATSATINTLSDTNQNWTTNIFGGLVVKITSGTGNGQENTVISNTATRLTVKDNWSTTPDATSQYEIYKGHQSMRITWGASNDRKHSTVNPGAACTMSNPDPTLNPDCGSGIREYKIYRDVDPNGSFAVLAGTVSANTLVFNDISLGDFTYYYYKVTAGDNGSPQNVSTKSTASPAKQTASSAVPTTPTNVTVTSVKGDPINTNVGHGTTVTFKGSYAKNCLNNIRCLVRYEVYRSNTNYSDDADWLTSGTRLELTNIGTRTFNAGSTGSDITPTRNDDDRDYTYTIHDSGLTDATVYYYKVRAVDNTPTDPDGGPFKSPLSAITVDNQTAGWDITPDVTAPSRPAGGLDVQVKDTHPNDVELRNIITWRMLQSNQMPLRKKEPYETCNVIQTINGVGYCSDFSRYEVWREAYDPTGQTLEDTTRVDTETDLGQNLYTDNIGENDMVKGLFYLKDCQLKYYLVLVDNAGTDFKYPDGSVINSGFDNSSTKEYWSDIIIPSHTSPSLTSPVTVSDIGVASATVSWGTDQPADSLVQFRKVGDTDYKTIGQIERTPGHTVKLFGLEKHTTYEYQIVSRNYLGNNVQNVGNLTPFETEDFAITYQPDKFVNTTISVELHWTTNMPSNTNTVDYRLSNGDQTPQSAVETSLDLSKVPASKQNCTDTPGLCNHTVTVDPLRSSSEYTFKIKSVSLDNYVAESDLLSFTTATADTRQFTMIPASSNVADRNITATTAQIIWQTAMPTTAVLKYGIAPGAETLSAIDSNLSTSHVIKLTGLNPGTTYYYYVEVTDINRLSYKSPEYSFKAILKPKIENLQIINVKPYSVTISWETNVDTETLLNWGTSPAYGEKKGNQGMSKAHVINVEDLTDATQYHFQILAHDEAGNEVADEDRMVTTPLDTAGPQILGVKTDLLPVDSNSATASVIISWQTDKPSTTKVAYDEGVIGGKYTQSSIEDKSLNLSHSVIIKDLKPASSYHFKIISLDKRGNEGVSPDHTFVTPTKEQSILQLILKSLEDTFAWTGKVGSFFGNIGKRVTGK